MSILRALPIKSILTHFAAGVLGLVIGVVATYWIWGQLKHMTAYMAVAVAGQELNAGEEDRAIVVLSQATAMDPEYYEPYRLLGKIFGDQGNTKLALDMYRKVLKTLGKETFVPEGGEREARDSIRSQIANLQVQLEDRRGTSHRK